MIIIKSDEWANFLKRASLSLINYLVIDYLNLCLFTHQYHRLSSYKFLFYIKK